MNVAIMTALLSLEDNLEVVKVDTWKYVYRVSFNKGKSTFISKTRADRLLVHNLILQEYANPSPIGHSEILGRCFKALSNSSIKDFRIVIAKEFLGKYIASSQDMNNTQDRSYLRTVVENLYDFCTNSEGYTAEEGTLIPKLQAIKKNNPLLEEVIKLTNYVQIQNKNGMSLRSKMFQDAESIPDWCSFSRGREGYYWTSNYGDSFLKQKAESLISQFDIKEAELV